MLVDANLLLYAVDDASPHHGAASRWLTEVLNGDRRVAMPAASLTAFIRISTHPRLWNRPLTSGEAWDRVQSWLDVPVVWVPTPTESTLRILGDLVQRHQITGNLVPDAQLAALALEHGIPVCSADSDFARFSEVTWTNPLR